MEAHPLDKEANMELTDRKAQQLADLLVVYFRDCVGIDLSTASMDELTVRMLLEDLATSTNAPESREIETCIDVIDALIGGARNRLPRQVRATGMEGQS
jgi:hypothetical protein